MYNKQLESDREAKRQHDENLKKAAAERLARNAKWNKSHKTSEKENENE